MFHGAAFGITAIAWLEADAAKTAPHAASSELNPLPQLRNKNNFIRFSCCERHLRTKEYSTYDHGMGIGVAHIKYFVSFDIIYSQCAAVLGSFRIGHLAWNQMKFVFLDMCHKFTIFSKDIRNN